MRPARDRALAILDRTHEDHNANAFWVFLEEPLILPGRRLIYSDLLIFSRRHIGMVDLGFTIVCQSDEKFYTCIRAGAPCDRVPAVAAAEAEEIAEAYLRYSYLIGIAEPGDEAERAVWATDVLAHPELADSGSFVYEDAERLLEQWSGVGPQAIRAYLYEELVYTAACGLVLCPGDDGPDEEYCHDLIVMHHARWFGATGEAGLTSG